jgi:hypothetical protein
MRQWADTPVLPELLRPQIPQLKEAKNPHGLERLPPGTRREVLIVGAGLAGMSAALELAERGYQEALRASGSDGHAGAGVWEHRLSARPTSHVPLLVSWRAACHQVPPGRSVGCGGRCHPATVTPMRQIRSASLLAMAVSALSCADDPLIPFCTESGDGFDIEAVSALEGNIAWQGTSDGVVLTYDDPRLLETPTTGEAAPSWRVSSVDVFVMLSEREFNAYTDDAVLEVQIHDGANPSQTVPYTLRQTMVRDALVWAPETLAVPPEGPRVDDGFGFPAINEETRYFGAWWRFDLREIIPETGMDNTTYFLGLHWPTGAAPLVGYSLYNRPCEANWSNYDQANPPYIGAPSSGWQSNAARGEVVECNWPMFKVNTELRSACDAPPR